MEISRHPACRSCKGPFVVIRKVGTEVVASVCNSHAEYYMTVKAGEFEIVSGTYTAHVTSDHAACVRCGRVVGHGGNATHNRGNWESRKVCK